METPIKVVFDTQIYLRTLINVKSLPAQLLTEYINQYQLITARQLVDELRDVLTRTKIRLKFPQITRVRVEKIIENITQNAVFVTITPEDIEPICRDEKDNIFLACAKIALADYLVSEDNDLLVIGQHHTTRIINVKMFVDILESNLSDSDE